MYSSFDINSQVEEFLGEKYEVANEIIDKALDDVHKNFIEGIEHLINYIKVAGNEKGLAAIEEAWTEASDINKYYMNCMDIYTVQDLCLFINAYNLEKENQHID